MPNSLRIVLIGAGNVATHLGKALFKAKHSITQVYSRKLATANELANITHAQAIHKLSDISPEADVYIIAIKDDAIEKLTFKLHLKGKIIVHTSGSVPIDILKKTTTNRGVFYPLQTFSKSKHVNFKNIPICLEAENEYTYTLLEALARSISNNVLRISSEQRINIHIAAVFACNFTNHMYSIAYDILTKHQLSLDLIKPLIVETAEKIKNNPPNQMQTGPAVRGDKTTMDKHLKMLKDKDYRKLYRLVSNSIQKAK